MAASVLTRPSITDDDGSGTTGTIITSAWIGTAIYDLVDAVLSGTGAYAALTVGGRLRAEGGILDLKGVASPAVSASGDARLAYNTTLGRIEKSINAGAFSGLGAFELLKAGDFSDSSAGATNLDTFALASQLSAKDALYIRLVVEAVTQNVADVVIYNTTDSVTILSLLGSSAPLVAGQVLSVDIWIQPRQNSLTAMTAKSHGLLTTGANRTEAAASTFSTNWTGAWTGAIRHTGVVGGGTVRLRYQAFILRGQ